MPSEKTIRNYVINRLQIMGYQYWYPARTKFRSQQDIFGVIDILGFKGKSLKFIQFTDITNFSHRRKKVEDFIKRTRFGFSIEVWGWNPEKRDFKIEVIRQTKNETRNTIKH